ncbi:hypothetical protein [Vibrio splendidus]|uniref:hypothetical protein n=1 Tax=Vibrio splendidus TaxID=29497 RepID=UPI000C835501|nr:hypothetical protein [Vibrio splendidus]PMO52561.1 hypothetical protein BCT08_21460 [Vibrio splendidus]
MNIEELLHVGGAVRPLDKIQDANASYEAGFLGSRFYQHSDFSEWAEIENQKAREYDQWHFLKTKKSAETWQLVKDGKLSLICPEYYTKPNREAHAVGVETIGLSKGAKVRHDKIQPKVNRISQRLRVLQHPTGRKTELDSRRGHDNFESLYTTSERNQARILPYESEKVFTPSASPISVHLQKRDWSGQYRAQVISQTPVGNAPDANFGERYTDKLTKRSVSKIFESGAYVAQCHDGFTTFITLTFSREQRFALFAALVEAEGRPYTPIEFVRDEGSIVHGKDGAFTLLPEKPFNIVKTAETTMGREVSRFLDGCKKMYQRGWETESGDKVAANYKAKLSEFGPDRERSDFHYVWVAECPPSKDSETKEIIGEPNPHIHLIMRWSVEPVYFRDWAKRLEALWGKGMAHIEWIKQPKAASTYLIKALGYAAKGENADQGLIRGNRYNIARCSRAPSWETLATFEAHNITAVIKELGYKLEQWKKPMQRSLKRINAQKDQTVKAKAIATKQDKPQTDLDKLQGRIIRLEHAAKKVSQDMKQREMHVSSQNRFSITFDGEQAKSRLDKFLFWAAGARGWSMEVIGATGQYCEKEQREIYGTQHDIDLSDIRELARELYRENYQTFIDKRAYWRSVLEDSFPIEPSEMEINNAIADKYLALGY